ncbi:hypothetical protein [Blastomonas fulva]|uniref:hypothetical protein n=1 Tax=Blastomonas fulva TaxID=1550728 RepID=UPI003F72667A
MKNGLLVAVAVSMTASPLCGQQQQDHASAPAQDPMFAEPYVDVDEWRAAPVRHRYVHGGFKGTDMRFSFYFPDKAQYQNRFFQYVTPVPDNENLAQAPGDDKIGFSISSGAYFIETNGGGTSAIAGPAFRPDPTIGAFRANAAAAIFSRTLAAQMYGPHRTYGYLYGGSGGGYRTLGSMENTVGVWDGAVPFVLGTPMAAPNVFAVRMHAMRILEDRLAQIADAMDVGGSGDPYAGLNAEEAGALREVTRMGFPLKSWFGHKTMGVHAFTALYQGMVMADPGYFSDFWTKPGYLGFDRPEAFKNARLQFDTTVEQPLGEEAAVARGVPDVRIPGTSRGTAELAWQSAVKDGSARPVAIALRDTPPGVDFLGGDLVILSGEAAGQRLALRAIKGNIVTLGVVDSKTLARLKPGDAVRIDNSNFLAAQTYHRHQVPGPEYPVWDQFRRPDGQPVYPQRPVNLGPLFAMGAAGTVPTGKFNGKIIVVGATLDREAFAWQSDWYRQRFEQIYGADAGNRYRLWFAENALHGASEWEGAPTRVINYTPLLQQALRDVAAWVERGVPPPANSGYRVDDGQVILAGNASDRKGIQPIVTLRIGGADKAYVKTGEPFELVAEIEVPPGAGKIVDASWEFEGTGRFVSANLTDTPSAKMQIRKQWHYDTPGTFFVTLKVESERDGNASSTYARIPNLSRARVIVSP